MSTPAHRRHGPVATIGYLVKRTATFLYGPADLPDDVDPIVQMDKEMGVDTHPADEPHVTDRQRAFDSLPRDHE